MKITLLISSLSGGGAERVVCNLANHLLALGHEVDLLSVSDIATYQIEPGVRHVCMTGSFAKKLPLKLKNIFRAFKFNNYLRSCRSDVIVSFLPSLSVMLMKQRIFFKCPIVLAERADPKQYKGQLLENILNYYRFARGFMFQTEEARDFYIEKGLLENTPSVVIPNAINPVFIRPPFQGEYRKAIVGVGRLDDQKNFPLLIEAFAKIHPLHPDYSLEIYGDGADKEKLVSLVSDLGIENHVSFRGFVPNIPEAIEGASLFVLSSNFEGMPNALAEAMALGLPCISTDCPAGGSRFLIKNGENGILVPVNDLNAMAEAMDSLLSNPTEARNMAEKAREITKHLAPDKIYAQWERFLTKVVNDNSSFKDS